MVIDHTLFLLSVMDWIKYFIMERKYIDYGNSRDIDIDIDVMYYINDINQTITYKPNSYCLII